MIVNNLNNYWDGELYQGLENEVPADKVKYILSLWGTRSCGPYIIFTHNPDTMLIMEPTEWSWTKWRCAITAMAIKEEMVLHNNPANG